MTRLCSCVVWLLLWLLFMMVSVACANSAGSEQLAQGAPAASRAILFTQQEEPDAIPTPTATRRYRTPPAQPLESTATGAPSATATTAPTFTPSPPGPTPVPLTTEAIAGCPVSLPNLEESPNDYYISTRFGYGNPERTMFIGLWSGGKVYFLPGGPGVQSPDGSLGMKFWFYRTVPGDVVIGGQRLDAPAPPMPETVLRGEEDGYWEVGFHPAGLVFPSEGCWEVTARIGEEEMRAVMLVVRLSFAPLRVRWLPEGVVRVDTDLSRYPTAIAEIYGKENGEAGQLLIETGRHLQDVMAMYSQALGDPVLIDGHTGVCVKGMQGEAGEWQYNVDAAAVAWRDDDLAYQYQIRQEGLGLACRDLLRVAELKLSSHAVSTATVEPAAVTTLPSEPPGNCPVTQPPDPPFDPSGKPVEAFSGKFWYGSDDLYLALPLDGTWSQLARGEKVFWWSAHYAGEPRPTITILAQRLDQLDQIFEQSGATNASHASFPATAMLHGLQLPSHGCWEITGQYKGEALSFVVWVP